MALQLAGIYMPSTFGPCGGSGAAATLGVDMGLDLDSSSSSSAATSSVSAASRDLNPALPAAALALASRPCSTGQSRGGGMNPRLPAMANSTMLLLSKCCSCCRACVGFSFASTLSRCNLCAMELLGRMHLNIVSACASLQVYVGMQMYG